MDFVVGMRVHKSNNHPTEDICDVLAGDYPKTFKFSAWHPQCRCYVTSILCTKEEMMQMQRDILAGKSTNGFRSVNEVRTVPKAFTDWVDANGDRIMRAKALPYFLKDNGKIVDGKWVYGKTTAHDVRMKVKTEGAELAKIDGKVKAVINDAKIIPDLASIDTVSEDVAIKSAKAALVGKSNIKDIAVFSENAFGAWDKRTGTIFISDVTLKNANYSYNALISLRRGLAKIKKGVKLNKEEEYAFEVLHHERYHASAKGWRKGRVEKLSRPMEALNQLCARHSYEQTLSLFGRTPIYKDSIIEQGYSYNRSVSNLRSMIKEIGVSEKEFVKIFRSILQESYYDDIQATLAEYFKSKGIINAEECIKKLEKSEDVFQELLSVKN
ncbi:MAG: hypothetical protein UHT92_05720 [Prevotella sp.]|nr:hypothetical protein [Prevotella sp.]